MKANTSQDLHDAQSTIHTSTARSEGDNQSIISEASSVEEERSAERREEQHTNGRRTASPLTWCCRKDSTSSSPSKNTDLGHNSTKRDSTEDTKPRIPYDAVDEEISELPDVNSWNHRPLFLTNGKHTRCKNYQDGKSLPICSPIEFESDTFKGKFMIRIRDAPHTEQGYFKGRKRTKQIVIQGKFKERVPCDDILLGDTYHKPLNISPLVYLAVPIFRRLVPGVILDLFSEKPRVVMLMGGEARTISIDKPGEEPDMTGELSEKNIEFMGAFNSVQHRKRILRDPKTASNYEYDNEHIHTFQFYDDIIDIYNFSINLPFGKIPLLHFLNSQPMTFAVVRKDEREFFSFKVFHEQLVKKK